MKKQQWFLLVLTLGLIGGATGYLLQFRQHQQLGRPGVKTRLLADGQHLEVVLPEEVLGFESEPIAIDPIVTNTLPKDTSYGQRLYRGADGFQALVNVVLMGTDRTSLHKPQICLEGQGWRIDPVATLETRIRLEKPYPYDLPVVKLVATRQAEGQPTGQRGLYVYWFVADGALSASVSGLQRMWWMARDFVRTGVLQRWAYISCFTVCAPGQEEAAYERMKALLAGAVPEFQLTPQGAAGTVLGRQ